MLITHSKYDDLSAYFLLQLYSGQFPSELQSPVNMLFRMEIPLGKENVGSTHKAMGTPSRLFAKWQLMEVPWYFLFSSVDFFSRLFMEAGFFLFFNAKEGWMILLNVVGKNRLYNYAAFVIYTDQQRPVNWRLLESLCPLKYSFLQ